MELIEKRYLVMELTEKRYLVMELIEKKYLDMELTVRRYLDMELIERRFCHMELTERRVSCHLCWLWLLITAMEPREVRWITSVTVRQTTTYRTVLWTTISRSTELYDLLSLLPSI